MGADAEAIDSIPDIILEEILLKLPSAASLVRAAFVSKNWGRIISSKDFISRYRKLHPSSPLLGFFFSNHTFGLPDFHLLDLVRSDDDLKAVQCRADLLLANLAQDSGWRILDSHNGRLLLCRAAGESGDDSFSIYNPVSRQLVLIPVNRPRDQVAYFADFLLNDSLRVVSVQQYNRWIRAVEYDPDTLEWRIHQSQSPWALDGPKKLKPWGLEPMRAAGLIFWRYDAALSLVLDCSSMQFWMCPIPVTIRSRYAIGEIEDGVGCFVSLDDTDNTTTSQGTLQVWVLKRNNGGCPDAITWELSGEPITVRELLGPVARVRQVLLVTNGLAVLSWNNLGDQFVIDLRNRSLHAKFCFRGQAYPYQIEWPPAGLHSLQNICQEEAQPVQLVLPVEPAAPLHDADVPVLVDDTGLAELLDDIDLAAGMDDKAYMEAIGCGFEATGCMRIEHIMAAEADNMVRTAKDGMHLMETKVADTAAPSADSVEGMPHSSEAISRKPRYEEALQSGRDVPPEKKDQGPIIVSDFNVNADVLELVEPGEAHVQLAMNFYSSTDKDVIVEHLNSSVPPEATFKGFVSSFRVDPPLLPAPCFPPMSLQSNNHSPVQFFDEATYTEKVKSEALYTEKVKNSDVRTGHFQSIYADIIQNKHG